VDINKVGKLKSWREGDRYQVAGRQEIEPIITAPKSSFITARQVSSSPDSRFPHHRAIKFPHHRSAGIFITAPKSSPITVRRVSSSPNLKFPHHRSAGNFITERQVSPSPL
jgi:hypothetical protein